LTAGKKRGDMSAGKGMEGQDKKKKLKGEETRASDADTVVYLFNRSMDEMGEGASGQLQDHPQDSGGGEGD
jgi:hypothetical protein